MSNFFDKSDLSRKDVDEIVSEQSKLQNEYGAKINRLAAQKTKAYNELATKFSNESESRMTSLGFYVTGAIYNGKYDYSMKIHGLEYSNNNAFERGVVVHSADYATYEFLQENGNILGRSYGCPALPHDNYQTIVDIIQGGSCFFAYGKDRGYERKSTYLKTTSFIESFYSDFPQ